MTATIGQWISYGAIFVAPGCALLLCAVAWRRGGLRRAMTVALHGLPWLASFAAHYYLVLRHAALQRLPRRLLGSGLPPSGSIDRGALTWLAQQAEPLASHPGGTTLWWSFWLVVAYGIAATARNRPVVAAFVAAGRRLRVRLCGRRPCPPERSRGVLDATRVVRIDRACSRLVDRPCPVFADSSVALPPLLLPRSRRCWCGRCRWRLRDADNTLSSCRLTITASTITPACAS